MGGNREEAIRERAYYIWQREGCPPGKDFEHWVQAQIELEAESVGKRSAAGNGGRAAGGRARAAAAREKAPASTRTAATGRAPRAKKSQ